MFIKNYDLKTIKNGMPLIFFTPFLEPIPRFIDNEIVSLPTILIIEQVFRRSSASFLLTNFSQ